MTTAPTRPVDAEDHLIGVDADWLRRSHTDELIAAIKIIEGEIADRAARADDDAFCADLFADIHSARLAADIALRRR